MITKQKKIVYGIVLTGSVGMLVTQLLAREKGASTPPPIEVSALGDSAPVAEASAASGATTTISGDGSSGAAVAGESSVVTVAAAEAGAPASSVDHALEKLERALGSLRNFQPDALRPALDQLVQPPVVVNTTPQVVDTPSATTQVELPEIELPQLDDLKQRSTGPAPFDLLRAQLEAQPLCGILHGARDSAAMFGGRIVRVGDQLLPGDAVVTAIEPKAVRVNLQGNELRIEMPPFRPRPSSKSSEESSDEKSDKETEDESKDEGKSTSESDMLDATTSLADKGKKALEEMVNAITQDG